MYHFSFDLALLLGFVTHPLAEGQERRVLFTNRAVFKMPSLSLGRDDREWRHQPPGFEGIGDIERLRNGDANAVERSLHGHGIVIEHHFASWRYRRAHARRLEPAWPIVGQMW